MKLPSRCIVALLLLLSGVAAAKKESLLERFEAANLRLRQHLAECAERPDLCVDSKLSVIKTWRMKAKKRARKLAKATCENGERCDVAEETNRLLASLPKEPSFWARSLKEARKVMADVLEEAGQATTFTKVITAMIFIIMFSMLFAKAITQRWVGAAALVILGLMLALESSVIKLCIFIFNTVDADGDGTWSDSERQICTRAALIVAFIMAVPVCVLTHKGCGLSRKVEAKDEALQQEKEGKKAVEEALQQEKEGKKAVEQQQQKEKEEAARVISKIKAGAKKDQKAITKAQRDLDKARREARKQDRVHQQVRAEAAAAEAALEVLKKWKRKHDYNIDLKWKKKKTAKEALLCARISQGNIDNALAAAKNFKKTKKAKKLNLTTDQLSSLYAYTTNIYGKLNFALRNRDDPAKIDKYKPLGWHIVDALKKLPDYEGTVYRGDSGTHLEPSQYTKGAEIHYQAFTSTSTSKSVAKGFAGAGGYLFIIDVQNAKDIKAYSAIPGEEECLLAANTRFIVTQGLKVTNGVNVIKLQQITPDSTVWS
jgi:hypothetical protein